MATELELFSVASGVVEGSGDLTGTSSCLSLSASGDWVASGVGTSAAADEAAVGGATGVEDGWLNWGSVGNTDGAAGVSPVPPPVCPCPKIDFMPPFWFHLSAS